MKASGGSATATVPKIHEATAPSGSLGVVIKGTEIDEAGAIGIRKEGGDIVVCGDDTQANRAIAEKVEQAAVGLYRVEKPHKNAGLHALPHCQPAARPPAGHSFYESRHKKARKQKP